MQPGQRITICQRGEEITGLVLEAVKGPVNNGILQWQVKLLTRGYVIEHYTVSDEDWRYASYAA
jgi:hypothetical protein